MTIKRVASTALVGKRSHSIVALTGVQTSFIGFEGSAETVSNYLLSLPPACIQLARCQTTSIFLNFVLAMVLHPEVQKRAHSEIDSVVGSDRLPTFDDRKSLPYVEAICRETLRWYPAAPLGRL